MTLSEHQSHAAKARWARLSPKERKRLMSLAGVKSAAARRKGKLRLINLNKL